MSFDFRIALIETIIGAELFEKFIGKPLTNIYIQSMKYFIENKITEYYYSGRIHYKPSYKFEIQDQSINFELIPQSYF